MGPGPSAPTVVPPPMLRSLPSGKRHQLLLGRCLIARTVGQSQSRPSSPSVSVCQRTRRWAWSSACPLNPAAVFGKTTGPPVSSGQGRCPQAIHRLTKHLPPPVPPSTPRHEQPRSNSTVEETRGHILCPKVHSQKVTESGMRPRPLTS